MPFASTHSREGRLAGALVAACSRGGEAACVGAGQADCCTVLGRFHCWYLLSHHNRQRTAAGTSGGYTGSSSRSTCTYPPTPPPPPPPHPPPPPTCSIWRCRCSPGGWVANTVLVKVTIQALQAGQAGRQEVGRQQATTGASLYQGGSLRPGSMHTQAPGDLGQGCRWHLRAGQAQPEALSCTGSPVLPLANQWCHWRTGTAGIAAHRYCR